MKKFHSEKNEGDETQAYNDMLGVSIKDFKADDLMDNYSNSMNVESKSTGEVTTKWDCKIGKVKVIGS